MGYIAALLLVLVTTGSAATQTAVEKPDARLDQKVTLEVSHEKLEDVCKQLTDQTGVTIKAGSGERDWKVRERRVTIEARDIELGTLMKEISKLLGFYLSKSGKEGEWAYLYWQDLKARTLESEMLSADKEAAAQKLTARRQATLDAAHSALKMTPEEAAKARKDDPFTAYLAGTKSGRGFAELLSGLATQYPVERDLMLRGKRVTLQIDSLPANLRQAAIDTTAGGIIAAEMKNEGRDLPGDLSPHQIVIMPLDQNTQYEAGLLGLSGAIVVNGLGPDGNANANVGEFGVGEPMSLFVLTQPDSPIGELVGEALFAIDSGEDPGEVGKRVNESAAKPEFLAGATGSESPTEKKLPTDPKLTREIEISEDIPALTISGTGRTDKEMAKALIAVSKAIGMPVLLESFSRLVPPGGHIQKGKQPLYRILIGLERAGYIWEMSDEALRIRPRNWALRRSYEIPESYLARYRSLLEEQGEFTLDDVAMIASELTDEQISNTLMADPEFSEVLRITMTNDMGSTRPMLRFYHSLTAQQRPTIGSESGLPFAALTSEQWEKLSEIITDKLGGVYVQDGSVRHKPVPLDETNNMVQDNFEITVVVADQREPSVVKERILRWRKGQIETFREARRKAEETARAAEQQKTEETK